MSDYSFFAFAPIQGGFNKGEKSVCGVFWPQGVVVIVDYLNSGCAVPPELFTLVVACQFKDTH